LRARTAAALTLVTFAAVGLAPSEALAHGTIQPRCASHGSLQRFVVFVPNVSTNVPLTGFRITPPAGVRVEAVEAGQGWAKSFDGPTLVWTGSSVPAGERGVFAFRAELPAAGDSITFQAEESYPNLPRTGLFPLRVALSGPGAAAESSSGGLVVALLVAAGVVFPALGWVLVGRRRPSKA
jgi:hypothetical protein